VTGQVLQREAEKADGYSLLSACYYAPEGALLARLRESEALVNRLFPESVWRECAAERVGDLRVDHSRLFVGPYKALAPPHGSAYLEDHGQVMGDSTMDALRWYREEGVDIALKELPDHIIVELEFLHLLSCRHADAISRSDAEAASVYLEKEASFADRHLGRWVTAFAERVRAHAETDFYKTLASVTESFVQRSVPRPA
jgi:TorA maturation chaperone TorD